MTEDPDIGNIGWRPGRWATLGVLATGFVTMTLCWFVMPATFGGVGERFEVGIPDLALLVSAFVIGYGVMHIPAGFLAARFGLRAVLAVGLGIEGLLTAAAGFAANYPVLLVLRVACGLAASVYAGIGIAAVSVWFRGREHALALGVVSASFSLGVAAALHLWADVVAATGWQWGLVFAGATTVVVALVVGVVYRVPPGSAALHGTPLTLGAIRSVLGSPLLWRTGIGFLGGYGAYFAASQLISTYAADERGFDSATVGLAALLVGIAGIPGSLVAGRLADRGSDRRPYIVGFLLVQVVGTALVPVAGAGWLWLAAFLIGFGFNGCFAVWQTVAGEDPRVAIEHIGTAVGLLLTIAAVGGFVVPWVFGLLVQGAGHTVAWVFLALVSVAFMAVTPSITRRSGTHRPAVEAVA